LSRKHEDVGWLSVPACLMQNAQAALTFLRQSAGDWPVVGASSSGCAMGCSQFCSVTKSLCVQFALPCAAAPGTAPATLIAMMRPQAAAVAVQLYKRPP
jgi:hypothetical protein